VLENVGQNPLLSVLLLAGKRITTEETVQPNLSRSSEWMVQSEVGSRFVSVPASKQAGISQPS